MDLSHIQPHLDSVDFLLVRITKYCNTTQSSKLKTECYNALSSLKALHSSNIHKFSSISYLTQLKETKRSKRGLIDAGGSLLKTFFGTLDVDDAIKFTSAINKVQSDEKQLTLLMRDNIHVIKSTISTFNSTMSKVKENEHRLNKNLITIENAFEKLSQTTDKLELKSQLSLVLTSVESIIMTLSFDIDDINNAILFSKMNVLHPTVLSPMQLFKELELHINYMPKHSELPVPLSLLNVNDIITVSDIVCYYQDNKLIFILQIPLVLSQFYNLYNLIPFPVPLDLNTPDTYVLIAPNKPYLAITLDRLFYSQLASVSACKQVKGQCYVCPLGNVYSTVANPTCETTLLTEASTKLPKSCQTRVLRGSIDVFQKISNNRWIFVQSDPGKCHIICSESASNSDEILFGSGILHLPKSCKAYYKTLTFFPSDTYTSNVTTNLSNFNIIVECCDTQHFNKSNIPLVKLNELNNFDSLVKASVQMSDFEKQLNKISEPSHLEKYSTSYLSLTYIVSIIILLYFLFKSRRVICPRQGCCVRIYNKNYTSQPPVPSIRRNVSNVIKTRELTSDSSADDLDYDVELSTRSLPNLKRNVLS